MPQRSPDLNLLLLPFHWNSNRPRFSLKAIFLFWFFHVSHLSGFLPIVIKESD